MGFRKDLRRFVFFGIYFERFLRSVRSRQKEKKNNGTDIMKVSAVFGTADAFFMEKSSAFE